MTLDPAMRSTSRGGMFYTGWVLSLLPVLIMLATAGYGLSHATEMQNNMAKMDVPARLFYPIMITEISCVIVYLVPNLATLGAILLTGYLGGAVMTHLRAGEPIFMPLIFGILIWLGLFLRDARVRALIPWRRTTTQPTPTLSI